MSLYSSEMQANSELGFFSVNEGVGWGAQMRESQASCWTCRPHACPATATISSRCSSNSRRHATALISFGRRSGRSCCAADTRTAGNRPAGTAPPAPSSMIPSCTAAKLEMRQRPQPLLQPAARVADLLQKYCPRWLTTAALPPVGNPHERWLQIVRRWENSNKTPY